jgi:protein subunit release factor A
MKMLIEIRAGEGGSDAKLFVGDLANAYIKLAGKFG